MIFLKGLSLFCVFFPRLLSSQNVTTHEEEDEFLTLLDKKHPFVDKSLFIEEFLNNTSRVRIINRPHGFGKSINLSMLKYFLTLSPPKNDTFDNLLISKVDAVREHRNVYPVVHLNFASLDCPSVSKFEEAFSHAIVQMYSDHLYLLESEAVPGFDKAMFKSILRFSAPPSLYFIATDKLLEWLKQHFNQSAVVLLEEYDRPFISAFQNGYYDEIQSSIGGLISRVFKESPLKFGVIIGTTGIGKSVTSLDSDHEITIADEEFADFFGFSEKEVVELLTKYKLHSDKLQEIKNYYGGYMIGGKILYNPSSVIEYCKKGGKVGNFWLQSAPVQHFYYFMSKFGAVPLLKTERLLRNGSIIQNFIGNELNLLGMKDNENHFWSVIAAMGYLTTRKKISNSSLVESPEMFLIPNQEIKEVFNHLMVKCKKEGNRPKFVPLEDLIWSVEQQNRTSANNILFAYLHASRNFFNLTDTAIVGEAILALDFEFGTVRALKNFDEMLVIAMRPDSKETSLVFCIKPTKNDTKLDKYEKEQLFNETYLGFGEVETIFIFIKDDSLHVDFSNKTL